MPLPPGLDHINLWLIEDGDGWTVVDTGLKSDEIRALWLKILAEKLEGRPVTRVIVTHMHPDHSGQAGWFHRALGAPIWMTEGEYRALSQVFADSAGPSPEAVEFFRRGGYTAAQLKDYRESHGKRFGKGVEPPPVAYRRIADGERIGIGGDEWRVVVGSGHSFEHACLYSPARKILISGDQVLPRISSNVSVVPIEPEADPMSRWIASLAKLKGLPDDLLVLPSHDDPFFGLHERLDALNELTENRLTLAREALSRPLSVADLVPRLFRRELGPFQFMLAMGEARALLHCLTRRGQATRRGDPQGVDYFEAMR